MFIQPGQLDPLTKTQLEQWPQKVDKNSAKYKTRISCVWCTFTSQGRYIARVCFIHCATKSNISAASFPAQDGQFVNEGRRDPGNLLKYLAQDCQLESICNMSCNIFFGLLILESPPKKRTGLLYPRKLTALFFFYNLKIGGCVFLNQRRLDGAVV